MPLGGNTWEITNEGCVGVSPCLASTQIDGTLSSGARPCCCNRLKIREAAKGGKASWRRWDMQVRPGESDFDGLVVRRESISHQESSVCKDWSRVQLDHVGKQNLSPGC